MNQFEVSSYLSEAQTLFIQIEKFLRDRIQLFETGARGQTRFVTAFIDRVVLLNIQRSSKKIEAFKENLETPELSEAELEHMATKTTRYLKRLEKYLTNIAGTQNDAARYIPTPTHRAQSEKSKEFLIKCGQVLDYYVPHAEIERKNWMGRYLGFGNFIADTLATGFGLNKTIMFKRDMTDVETAETRQAALERLEQIVNEINELTVSQDSFTKTTQRALECEGFHDEPTSEMYREYFPSNIAEKMADFVNSMRDPSKDKATLTTDNIHAKIEMNYPTPLSIRPF